MDINFVNAVSFLSGDVFHDVPQSDFLLLWPHEWL